MKQYNKDIDMSVTEPKLLNDIINHRLTLGGKDDVSWHMSSDLQVTYIHYCNMAVNNGAHECASHIEYSRVGKHILNTHFSPMSGLFNL